MNVARASLDELLLDYEDFLRQRSLTKWDKGDPDAIAVRAVGQNRREDDRTDPTDQSDPSDEKHALLYAKWLTNKNPEVVTNTLICLIHQTNYLLDKQIRALESQFVKEGGYSERLAVARIVERTRKKNDQSDPTDQTDQTPSCPKCGKPMVLRTAQKGPHAGKQFWGCAGYPACHGTRRA